MTKQLPYDYSRCSNETCPLRSRCLRFLSPGRQGYQLYNEFEGGEDCRDFIDANDKQEEI